MNKIRIIGVPTDFGANIRGANMAPAALRIAGLHEKIKLLGWEVEDVGDLAIPIRETLSFKDSKDQFLNAILKIAELTALEVEKAFAANTIPLVLGGDHCVAIGTISGVATHFKKNNKKCGVIWIDAHADINTPETSLTKNIHGMPMSIIIGKGYSSFTNMNPEPQKINPKNIALIGIRMLDGAEKDLLKSSGIRYFTMREIDERGMPAVMAEAIAVASRGTDGIHLSFDLDGIDPMFAPGVSTPVTGGISYREAHLLLEMLADTKKITSMEFVEYNPLQDEKQKTANLITEFIQSALGKSIV